MASNGRPRRALSGWRPFCRLKGRMGRRTSAPTCSRSTSPNGPHGQEGVAQGDHKRLFTGSPDGKAAGRRPITLRCPWEWRRIGEQSERRLLTLAPSARAHERPGTKDLRGAPARRRTNGRQCAAGGVKLSGLCPICTRSVYCIGRPYAAADVICRDSLSTQYAPPRDIKPYAIARQGRREAFLGVVLRMRHGCSK